MMRRLNCFVRPTVLDSVNRIVQHLWLDEQADYRSAKRAGDDHVEEHIFRDLVRVDRWLRHVATPWLTPVRLMAIMVGLTTLMFLPELWKLAAGAYCHLLFDKTHLELDLTGTPNAPCGRPIATETDGMPGGEWTPKGIQVEFDQPAYPPELVWPKGFSRYSVSALTVGG